MAAFVSRLAVIVSPLVLRGTLADGREVRTHSRFDLFQVAFAVRPQVSANLLSDDDQGPVAIGEREASDAGSGSVAGVSLVTIVSLVRFAVSVVHGTILSLTKL
jgi:hypothetical protein